MDECKKGNMKRSNNGWEVLSGAANKYTLKHRGRKTEMDPFYIEE